MTRFRTVHPMALALCSTVLLAMLPSAQTMGAPERFEATAMNIDNGTAGTIDITVDRWSTDKQRDTLLSVMTTKGPDRLLDVLQDMPPVGHFGAPGNLSWDLRFARRVPLPDGGERIVLITDRRIGFWESANRPRSLDYPFTLIELRVNGDGEGEGKMSIATKVIYDKEQNMISLEDYATQPVRLTNVKRARTGQ
jgi:hypothetical protein